METKLITLSFSPHRIEALPLAAETMRSHEAIILEEPESPHLAPMLRGELPIDDYLLETDAGFPRFGRKSCQLLRELHGAGKAILQIEPFMERLLEIHDLFGNGGVPEEILEDSPHHAVYWAERRCTEALLDYYAKSSGHGFDAAVAATQAFAREDAARGRLRDRLRAEEIVQALDAHSSVYIEAGELHAALLPELKGRLPESARLRPLYLLDSAVRRFGGTSRGLGPGDLLTLIYLFRPAGKGPRCDLLAARNLIHVKILMKEEMEDREGEFPHTRDQIESNRLVEGLSYRECGILYEEIRWLETKEARRRVREYRQKQ